MEPRLFNREDFPFEPLIAALGALIALIILLDLRAINFWLSLLLVVVGVTVVSWTVNHGLHYFKRGLVWVVIVPSGLGIALLLALLLWNDYNNIRGVTVAAMLSTESSPLSIDARLSVAWERQVAAMFEKETGAIVNIVPAPPTVNRLKEYLRQLASPGSEHVDVYAIDVIWPENLAPYAENLKSAVGDLREFNRALIEKNTIGAKLVAVPWYSDAGLLFYRPRLLEKYGYNKPPDTWDELKKMAQTIQIGERTPEMVQKIQAEEYDIRKTFWGFLWQGKAYEGLTCNALEWQVSYGGGFIVDKNKVDIREPTITAFEEARKWIGDITPQEVLHHEEAETFDIWTQENVVFMRNWPYAYIASQAVSRKLANDIGVTLLPKGIGDEARHASTLGGWGLMVNAASQGKEKKAAIRFVQFMTRTDIQLLLATQTGKVPALIKLYDNSKVQESLKFLQNQSLKNLFTGDLIGETSVARPSASMGEKYPEISKTYFGVVHELLEDKGKDARQAIEDLRIELHNILEKP